jgi:hypothetical protein
LSRRRPVRASAGVVACLLALAGCSASDGPVRVQPRKLHGSAATACERLVDALPESVAEQPRRELRPPDAHAAAWGDPAIVLRCGVGSPAGFGKLSVCQVANGVAWFIPDEQIANEPTDVVMTTVDRRPRVEVRLPKEYFPPAAAMVQLASAIKRTTTRTTAC